MTIIDFVTLAVLFLGLVMLYVTYTEIKLQIKVMKAQREYLEQLRAKIQDMADKIG
jgi:hypothetical protein